MTKYLLTFELPESGALVSVRPHPDKSYSDKSYRDKPRKTYLSLRPTDDNESYFFDTEIDEEESIFMHCSAVSPFPWMNGFFDKQRPTNRLLSINSGLDFLAYRLRIPKLFFSFSVRERIVNGKTINTLGYKLLYSGKPVAVTEEVEKYFSQALNWNKISILRAESIEHIAPSWYLVPLFKEMAKKEWLDRKLVISTDSSIQTLLSLPFEEGSYQDDLIPNLINVCMNYIKVAIDINYVPKDIDRNTRLMKDLDNPKDFFLERVSYPIFHENALRRIMDELKQYPTWPWISEELKINKVGDWYCLDYISEYLPDVKRVKSLQIFNKIDTIAPDEVSKNAVTTNLKITRMNRLIADGKIPSKSGINTREMK